MTKICLLHELLNESVVQHEARTAVEDLAGHSMTYRELGRFSDRLRDKLWSHGVASGDRVGMCLPKSIDSLVAIFGILKCGAAYVPVDPTAPISRNAFVFNNCTVKLVIAAAELVDELSHELDRLGDAPMVLAVENVGSGAGIATVIDADDVGLDSPPAVNAISPDSLAYILYTSGSTGRPKGVMISHRNALVFLDWCSATIQPTAADRFSSHAPFHFDLSILDIYVPFKHGAMLVLIGEKDSKNPATLAKAIADKGITVWYSTPSALSLLVQYGNLPDHDASRLRCVLFAGEVFPVKHLRALKSHWPAPRYFNLYGPTETNVCTYFELPSDVEDERTDPYPIGAACAHYQAMLVDAQAKKITALNTEGELCISGPGVMLGYWDLPEKTQSVFLAGDERWYRTGDLVREDGYGHYIYVGRRDRMVKKLGYRIELDEIEACLYRHDAIDEAAVVASRDDDHVVTVKAFVCTHGGERLSIIKLKKFCNEQLPSYMVPDTFVTILEMPKTSTDKTDYQKLMESP